MNPKALTTIGVIVLLLSHLGFPSSWDTIFYSIIGILLILTSLKVIYKEHIDRAYAMHERKDVEAYAERDPNDYGGNEINYGIGGEENRDESDAGETGVVADGLGVGDHESDRDPYRK